MEFKISRNGFIVISNRELRSYSSCASSTVDYDLLSVIVIIENVYRAATLSAVTVDRYFQ